MAKTQVRRLVSSFTLALTEVFYEIRTDEAMRAIPIIMLTGLHEKVGIRFSKEEMAEFYGEEPTAYIEKPIEPETLLAEVRKIIKAD